MPELRTMRDLSRSGNVADARHQLHRAATDAEWAAWAKTWGEAAIDRCAEVEDEDKDDWIDPQDLADAETEVENLREKLTELRGAAEHVGNVANDTDGITNLPDLDKAISDLETALLQCA